jgi:hypothetical protein
VTTISSRGKGKLRPPSPCSASNLHDVTFLAVLALIKATPACPSFHIPIEPSKSHHLSIDVLPLTPTTLRVAAHPSFHSTTQEEHTTFRCFSMATTTATTMMRPQPCVMVVPYPCSDNANPVLQVNKLLHPQGIYVTFVNTEHTTTLLDAQHRWCQWPRRQQGHPV